MVKNGRVVYLTEEVNVSAFWNIPIANTTVILLGTGTSITQAAVRLLASAGVMIGFSGGGGTPLFSGSEIEWFSPQSEYRPTEYVQNWLSFWFDENKRLKVAKIFQCKRLEFLVHVLSNDRDLQQANFFADDLEIENIGKKFIPRIEGANDIAELLSTEGLLAKQIYAYAAKNTGLKDFSRQQNDPIDNTNIFLNHGNYLAYGLAATVLWVLGIPHGFAVMHGKTRRGALVFDIADLIKDSLVLPWAFVAAMRGHSQNEFRELCLQSFTKHKAMDFMFDQIKHICVLVKENKL